MTTALKERLSKGALVLTLSALAACGGGSSGEGSSESACSEVGYSNRVKLADGTLCRSEKTSSSAIARLDVFARNGDEETCTGTVISSNAVLTAAHCLTDIDDKTREISGDNLAAVGVSLIAGGQEHLQLVLPENVFIHPSFRMSEEEIVFNDIAIIRTLEPLPVSPVALLTSRAPLIEEPAIVAGYGQLEQGGPPQEELSAGDATVRQVTEDHITVDYVSGESHPCKGDSGGALLLREGAELVIAGVVSQSAPDVGEENVCRVGDRTLYANLQEPEILGFILNVAPDAQLR